MAVKDIFVHYDLWAQAYVFLGCLRAAWYVYFTERQVLKVKLLLRHVNRTHQALHIIAAKNGIPNRAEPFRVILLAGALSSHWSNFRQFSIWFLWGSRSMRTLRSHVLFFEYVLAFQCDICSLISISLRVLNTIRKGRDSVAHRSGQIGEGRSLIFHNFAWLVVIIWVVHSLRRLDRTKFVIILLGLHHPWHLTDRFGTCLVCWLLVKRATEVVRIRHARIGAGFTHA